MDFGVLTCDNTSYRKGTIMLYYTYSIMHTIAKYWPQSVKQVPKSQTELFIEMIVPFSSVLGLLFYLCILYKLKNLQAKITT